MKKTLYLLFLLCALCFETIAQNPLVNYTFWDTVRYSDASFTASETYLSDLNDNGLVAGYYKNGSGSYVGFIYEYKKDKFTTYQQTGYTHTEILGISNTGEVLGRVYNSSPNSEVITGSFVNSSFQNMQIQTWYATNAQNQYPRKMNNNDFTVGSVRTGTTHWLHCQESSPPFTNQSTQRVQFATPPNPVVQYNTYGYGINDNDLMTGYYLDGAAYIPILWDNTNLQFYYNYPHKNPLSVGFPRTILTDINDAGYVTVNYRDNNYVMQGGLAKVDLSNLSSITYETDANFIFGADTNKTPLGSTISGINNKNDIVGYYKVTNTEVVGFFAFSDQSTPEIPGVLANTNNQYKIVNNAAYFDYKITNNHPLAYDYKQNDIWLNTNHNMFNDLIPLFAFKYISNLFQGSPLWEAERAQIYPSWRAHVWSQDENDCYITTPSGKLYTFSALAKWYNKSTSDFKGSCYGISAFFLQHLKDKTVLTNRFSNLYPAVTINDYVGPSYNNVALASLEAMTAAQQYQYDPRLKKYKNEFVKFNNLSIYDRLPFNKNSFHEIAKNLYSIDSARILSISYKDGLHATVPIKATREFLLKNSRDTLYMMNPNYDNTWTTLVIQPNQSILPTVKEYFSSPTPDSLEILALGIDGNLHEIDLANEAVLSFKNDPSAASNSSNKTINNERVFFVKKTCDFKIEEVGNPSNFYQVIGNTTTNQLSGASLHYDYNEDTLADAIVFNGNTVVRSSLYGGCDSIVNWLYSYPNGEMLYGRTNALIGETDVLIQDNEILKVESPDAQSKYVKLGAIYGPNNNEESFVSIDSFKIEQNDTVRYEAMDQYNFKLSNGKNANNQYNLYVRYLSANKYFTWDTKSIDIHPKTNHIIRLQPSVNGKEVIILVDSLQDGTIDDTIKVAHSGLNLNEQLKEQYEYKLYPNPTDKSFTVSLKGLPSGTINMEVYNQLGAVIYQNQTNTVQGNYHQRVTLENQPSGIYFVKLVGDILSKPITERIILNR